MFTNQTANFATNTNGTTATLTVVPASNQTNVTANNGNTPTTATLLTAVNGNDPNERDNLRILQTLNVQIQSMALKLDQILTQTEEVSKF